MTWRRVLLALAAVLPVFSVARSGHEQSIYPSYYPHEIEIATIAPGQAAERLREGKLHAYVGDALTAAGPSGPVIGKIGSLGGFVVARLNTASAWAADPALACRALAAAARALDPSAFVFHPYPVTPFHGDYLYHADRAEAARRAVLAAPQAAAPLRLRAADATAERLVPAALRAGGETWDVMIDEVRSRDLLAGTTSAVNGWIAPRWVRSGWFHAYRLLADTTDAAAHRQLDAEAARLQQGDHEDEAARINGERDLVAHLTVGCRAMVVGYTERREYFNSGFSTGVENIGFDALEGLRSPMFIRTVKLRDFPWNGWLRLGLAGAPAAAWNPVGGFTDEFGRLMWYAVGDPALLPGPYDSNWMLNRVSDVRQTPRR